MLGKQRIYWMKNILLQHRIVHWRNYYALNQVSHEVNCNQYDLVTSLIILCTGSSACLDAMQLLGIDGLLQKTEIERYYRDIRVHQILEGTNEIMRHIVGRSIVA